MTEESPRTESEAREVSWAPPARVAGLTPRRFRLILTAVAVAVLCGTFYLLVMSPLKQPHLHMIGLTSPGETYNSSWSVRSTNPDLYVDRTLQSMTAFSRELSLVRDDVTSSRSDLLNLANQSDWSNLPNSLSQFSAKNSDILVLFVSAQGLVRNHRAELHWSFNDDETSEPYVSVEDFLSAVKRHPAQTKLILLDAGWTNWAPQSGILLNDFPRELAELVHATNDPSLWLFCSHSVGRESTFHHPHQRSLFLESLLYGMRGPADINGDRLIDLRELMHLTTTLVNHFSLQNAGLESVQHPFLTWGGGAVRITQKWPQLIPVPTQEEIDQAAGAAEDGPPETTSTGGSPWFPSLLAQTLKPRLASPVDRTSSLSGPLAFFWWQGTPENKNSDLPAPADQATTQIDDQDVPASQAANKPAVESPEAEQSEEEGLSLGEQVLAVWSKRDELLEFQAHCCSPLEFAPLELIRLERELIRLDFLARSVSEIKRPMFLRQLQRIETKLDELAIVARGGRKPSLWMTDAQRTELVSRVHSIAMRQQFGNADDSQTTRLVNLIHQLRSSAKSGDWEAFRSLAASISNSDQKYEELGWAFRLSSLDDQISSRLKLRSFEICELSTELVASAWQAFPWIQEEFHAAERLRLSAERILIDGLISGTATEVGNLFDRAATEYLRIQSKVTELNQAASSLELATVRLPAYIEWARLVSIESRGPAPRPAELLQMAEYCENLRRYLQNQRSNEFMQLAKVAEELERLNESFARRTHMEALNEFVSEPHLPGEAKQWESLLQTPLVRANERAVLWSLLEDRVFDFASVSIPSLKTELGLKARPFATAEQRTLNAHLQLELQLLNIFDPPGAPDGNKTDGLAPVLREISDSITNQAAIGTQQSWFLSMRRNSDSLGQRWRTIASSLRTELPNRPEELTSEDSAANLLIWELKARMLSPALYGRRPPTDPTRLRLSASVRDFLNWNASRLQQFSPELPLELASLRGTWESDYRAAVVRFWPRSTVVSPEQESLRLSGKREIDFRVSGETTWTAECRNVTPEDKKIWLVLDYDRTQLELVGTNTLSVVTLEELRRDRTPNRLVDRLKLHSEPVTLPAGSAAQQIELKFQIRSIVGQPSSVVLYAISEQGNSMLKMIPRLPYSDLWSISSTAAAPTFEHRDGHNVLLPYPNRTTPFQFRLQYRGNRERTLDVSMFDLRAPLSSPNQLDFEENSVLLAELSQLKISPLNPNLDLKLPMAGSPESGTSVRGPLAFRVTDVETSEAHWIPLFVETQRPRRYLVPSISYDSQEGKLSLVLRAIDLSLLPEGPIPVVCEIEPIRDPVSAIPLEPIKLEGELSRDAPRLELLAVVPPKEGRIVTLKIHVDGFPRAFLFEIPCDASRAQIRELSGRALTTLSKPEPNAPFSTDVSWLDVTLQVDAPVGAFPDLSRKNHVALGLDLNADGIQTPGESWMILPSDRQSDLFLSGSEEGLLNLRTSVNDWTVRLPTGGVRNRRVPIQPRLVLRNDQVAGQPVSILIDGLAPKIQPAEIFPAVIGEPLAISLAVDDQNLSGVASVEGYLDRTRSGLFPEPVAPSSDSKEEVQSPADVPVSASLQADGYWLLELPSDSIRAGRHQILVRATDRAGNVSHVMKLSARLMTKEEAAGPQGARDVRGIVQFGLEPIPEAEVTLVASTPPVAPMEDTPTSFDAKSDEQGRFLFEDVPFGNWTLTVKAMVAGRLRVQQSSLTIAAPPLANRIQRVKLR